MSILSPSLRVGVLRGGPSTEYDLSLKSGAHVLKQIEDSYRTVDIFISKDGRWHMQGVEKSPERIFKHVDVVWNALHGAYGEDGVVQDILDHHGVKYSGSGRLPTALSLNKRITKEYASRAGIKTPLSFIVRRSDPLVVRAGEIFRAIPHPFIVKPVSGVSSLGLYFVQSLGELIVALETVLSTYESALVEEYIDGREATCGVIDHFRGSKVYALPPVEIIPPPGKTLLDYHSKHAGISKEICPGNFSPAEKREMEKMAADIHTALGLSHYSRSDFIASPRRGIYFLETNSLPGLTQDSLMHTSFSAVGLSMKHFIDHVLTLALTEK